MRTNAGGMGDRLRFESRAVADDGYGNPVSGDWTHRFTRSADVRPARGGEEVLAAKLQGVQPVRIIVYSDSETRTVTPEWRAVDNASGLVYAIRAVADEERRGQFLTLDAIAGAAP
jgi:head-tail adaptor